MAASAAAREQRDSFLERPLEGRLLTTSAFSAPPGHRSKHPTGESSGVHWSETALGDSCSPGSAASSEGQRHLGGGDPSSKRNSPV